MKRVKDCSYKTVIKYLRRKSILRGRTSCHVN